MYWAPITYKSHEVQGDKVVLSMDNVGGGLVAKGGDELKGFAIAGSDKKFVWATAHIEGGRIVVSSPERSRSRWPCATAWADNPVSCNLYNKADLPASPFRTDDWPGMTEKAQ